MTIIIPIIVIKNNNFWVRYIFYTLHIQRQQIIWKLKCDWCPTDQFKLVKLAYLQAHNLSKNKGANCQSVRIIHVVTLCLFAAIVRNASRVRIKWMAITFSHFLQLFVNYEWCCVAIPSPWILPYIYTRDPGRWIIRIEWHSFLPPQTWLLFK